MPPFEIHLIDGQEVMLRAGASKASEDVAIVSAERPVPAAEPAPTKPADKPASE